MDNLVSIIIPAYNAENYIARCLTSCISQTYENIEIILVNDGSKDRTLRICEEFTWEDSRIHIVDQENAGVSAARNVGLDVAIGDFIMFVDADDALMPNGIELLVNDAVTGNYHIVLGAGTLGEIPGSCTGTWKGTTGLIKSLEAHPFTHSVCGKLYSKSFIGELRFPVGKNINEDGYFLFECFLKKPTFFYRNVNVYQIYATSGSASRGAFAEKHLAVLELAQLKEVRIRELFPELLPMMMNVHVRANLVMLNLLCRTTQRKYANIETHCLRFVKKNKASFVPVFDWERLWYWIVTHHLYYPYKAYHQIKHGKKYR